MSLDPAGGAKLFEIRNALPGEMEVDPAASLTLSDQSRHCATRKNAALVDAHG
jgi:hypothetical protein